MTVKRNRYQSPAHLHRYIYYILKILHFTLHHVMIILMTCCDGSLVFTILLFKQTVHILKSKKHPSLSQTRIDL